MSFVKAVKTKAKLRLALCALAGYGKTYSALKIATALARMIREHKLGEGRIAVIDSERGSARLYADKFDFDVCELETFSPLSYVEKLKLAEELGYDIIIPDSLSHAWAGKDGALDQKDQAAERNGNSWTAWRNVTPKHNALVDALVGSKAHVIATMRTKMEYVQEVHNGKTEIKKVGLAAIQREGMEYEFTLVGDIDVTHALRITKTRCDGYINLGDMFEKPGENFAGKVFGWLMNGADAPVVERIERKAETVTTTTAVPAGRPGDAGRVVEVPADVLGAAIDASFAQYLTALDNAQSLPELDKAASGSAKPAKGTPNHAKASSAYHANKARIERLMADAKVASASGGEAVAS